MFSSDLTGQSLQAKLACPVAIFPFGQYLHSVSPINSENLPGKHNAHSRAPICETLPVEQGLHSFILIEPVL